MIGARAVDESRRPRAVSHGNSRCPQSWAAALLPTSPLIWDPNYGTKRKMSYRENERWDFTSDAHSLCNWMLG